MALWLARSGKHGQFESQFLEEGRLFLTWDGLNSDLSTVDTREKLQTVLQETYPDFGQGKIRNHTNQIFCFARSMQPEDWIAMPSKLNPTIHFGKIKSDYKHSPGGPDPLFHYREVEWFAQDVPRSNFDQDILYSLGAFLTFCRIKRNDAEARIKAMACNDWKAPKILAQPTAVAGGDEDDSDLSAEFDLEETANDQISRLILAKFKGHGLASLVGAILEAQGYTVHQPPPGPDHGVDLLAAPGALGFGDPRICVQVKSSDSPVERVVLDQLIGTMQNFSAKQGLLVSWGGFKKSIEKERASQFFRVRLWSRDDLIEQLLLHYDKLDEDLRTEIPLKQIWTIATPES